MRKYSMRSIFRRKSAALHRQIEADAVRLLFDYNWYLSQYNDVACAAINPLEHYLQNGWREGRWPNPIFDPTWYLAQNSDVAALGRDPLRHFVEHGRFEGRHPSAIFNPAEYLRINSDVAVSEMEPSEHYIRFGRLEGRSIRPSHSSGRSVANAFIAIAFDQPSNVRKSDLVSTVKCAVSELRRLDEANISWRDELFAKRIHRVQEAFLPVPDGLSVAYLELANSLNEDNRYDDKMQNPYSSLVEIAEVVIQREIRQTIVLEGQLLYSKIDQS